MRAKKKNSGRLDMVKFLRIFSHVTAFPALIFFFYFMLRLLGGEDLSGAERTLTIVWAFGVFLVPVFFNRLAKVLAGSNAKKA
jgi:hypothetical protein